MYQRVCHIYQNCDSGAALKEIITALNLIVSVTGHQLLLHYTICIHSPFVRHICACLCRQENKTRVNLVLFLLHSVVCTVNTSRSECRRVERLIVRVILFVSWSSVARQSFSSALTRSRQTRLSENPYTSAPCAGRVAADGHGWSGVTLPEGMCDRGLHTVHHRG